MMQALYFFFAGAPAVVAATAAADTAIKFRRLYGMIDPPDENLDASPVLFFAEIWSSTWT
jgi:hypothetical protein